MSNWKEQAKEKFNAVMSIFGRNEFDTHIDEALDNALSIVEVEVERLKQENEHLNKQRNIVWEYYCKLREEFNKYELFLQKMGYDKALKEQAEKIALLRKRFCSRYVYVDNWKDVHNCMNNDEPNPHFETDKKCRNCQFIDECFQIQEQGNAKGNKSDLNGRISSETLFNRAVTFSRVKPSIKNPEDMGSTHSRRHIGDDKVSSQDSPVQQNKEGK